MKRLTFEGNFCDVAMCRENPCPYDGTCSPKETWERLKAIEDILGDEYDLERLREMVEAEKDGRLVVLPCKVGDTLYRICRFKRGKNWTKEAEFIRAVQLNQNTLWRIVFGGEFGKTVFLTREAAEAALAKGAIK